MRFVIQVVSEASVTIDNSIKGSIGRGYMVLVGIGQNDNEQIADRMVSKLISLRIFPDENGKTKKRKSNPTRIRCKKDRKAVQLFG